MTRKEAKDVLRFIEAYANGQTLQMSPSKGKWIDIDYEPNLECFTTMNLRIKPEPKVIPFDFKSAKAAQLCGKTVIGKITGTHYLITDIHSTGMQISIDSRGFADILAGYEFIDGSPCGIITEE